MSTAVEEITPPATLADVPYLITSDHFQEMVERGDFPEESRVFLWGGRLYEKRAKTLPHPAVHNAFNGALTRRLPPAFFVGNENPVRLDEYHLPLPDLIVARGAPLDFFDTRFPDGRDVLLVLEVAVTSLPQDLGIGLRRYAQTLPLAVYVVADVPHRQVLVHSGPIAAERPGESGYRDQTVVGPGQLIHLHLAGLDLDPIPFEEVMR